MKRSGRNCQGNSPSLDLEPEEYHEKSQPGYVCPVKFRTEHIPTKNQKH